MKLYRSPLSQNIQKEYNNLIAAIALVPAQYRTKKVIAGTGGNVNVIDFISYHIGWGTLLIGWYEAGLKNRMPEMPGDGFTTWDYTGLAQDFYHKYQFDSFEQQLKEFHAIVTRILEIVDQEYQSGNLDKVGVWQWCTLPSGKQWPLSKWIQVNTAAPYRRTAGLIKKLLKTIS